MDVQKTREGNKLIVIVTGRIDTNTAPVLHGEVQAELDDVTELVFDFAAVDYISSAGIRAVLAAYQVVTANDDTAVVANASDVVKDVFDVSGLMSILLED